MSKTPISKQRLRLWLRLLRATRSIESDVRELMRREFGTTLPRFDVMAALYKADGGLTMGELSRELMVSNGNVTGIVERLEYDFLIERNTRDGDRRTSEIKLTRQGRESFKTMARAHEIWISRRLNDLNETEVEDAIRMLEAIGKSAERVKR